MPSEQQTQEALIFLFHVWGLFLGFEISNLKLVFAWFCTLHAWPGLSGLPAPLALQRYLTLLLDHHARGPVRPSLRQKRGHVLGLYALECELVR